MKKEKVYDRKTGKRVYPHSGFNWYCPPGSMIYCHLQDKNKCVSELAEFLNLEVSELNKILFDYVPLSLELADQITSFFNGRCIQWREYVMSYNLFQKRKQVEKFVKEYLKEIPYDYLNELGLTKECEKLQKIAKKIIDNERIVLN